MDVEGQGLFHDGLACDKIRVGLLDDEVGAMPTDLCGIDILFAEWIAIAVYVAFGVWLFSRWAMRDESPLPNWRWGDAPRRPMKSFEARVLEHIGGVAVFLSICVFGLRSLGLG